MKDTAKENRVVYFAEADFQGKTVPFGIKASDCLYPIVIIGGALEDRLALLEIFNKNFSKILSETGEYKLGPVTVYESLQDLPKETFGTIISLENLPPGEMCLQLMIDGVLSPPFKAKILPPPAQLKEVPKHILEEILK